MSQHADVIYNPDGKAGLKTETYDVGISVTIFGMVAYIFLVVPILTLAVVVVMNLSSIYGIAVAIAFVITGLYVTEKFACVNI